VLTRAKKLFFSKFNMGIKNAEFHADFESVEKVLKKCTKKVISKNVTEICPFFTFTHVRQTFFADNFFLVHFFQIFQQIRNQHEIRGFLIFSKKTFFGS
jgi:hypothetical protein